ncbi:MAG: relaxase/mobilization nuclease domain-containing protein [Campylobacterales bacterium]|nr:relaxase/mobilization nuclease domain-containing protein [Campylobacterales bacterium]
MVVKQVASKGKSTGSFQGLADYLLDKQNKGQKVNDFEFENCPFKNIEENLVLIKATGDLNKMIQSDKTLHLVVSFSEDEQPSKEVLKDIEKELLKSIGMEEHQRLIVSHNNTNNFHFHIAINKVHPTTHKLVDPYQSKNKLLSKASELEEKYNLRRDQEQSQSQKIEFKQGVEHGKREFSDSQRRAAVYQSSDRELTPKEQTSTINSMRTLSQCDVVHHTKGVKELLQVNEYDQLAAERTSTNHTVRWADNGNPSDGTKRERGVEKDSEIHSGMKNLSSWIKEELLEDMQQLIKDEKSNFNDLQKLLAAANLELKPRGNGMVIAHKTKNLFVKSSSIHRDLSMAKLEKRFGSLEFKSFDIQSQKEFGISKHNLWDEYKALSNQLRANKKEQFGIAKEQNTQAKEAIQSKYQKLINDTKRDIFLKPKAKRNIYRSLYTNRLQEYQDLSKNYKAQRETINKQTNQISYKEFLMQKALEGDRTALAVLRQTKPKLESDEKAILGKTDHQVFITKNPLITKQGLVVYKAGENGKIIDKGDRLKVTIDNNEQAIKEMLEMAMAKYGRKLDINGDIAFKQKVLAVTEKFDLSIEFKDETMREIISIQKEQRGEQKNINQESKIAI